MHLFQTAAPVASPDLVSLFKDAGVAITALYILFKIISIAGNVIETYLKNSAKQAESEDKESSSLVELVRAEQSQRGELFRQSWEVIQQNHTALNRSSDVIESLSGNIQTLNATVKGVSDGHIAMTETIAGLRDDMNDSHKRMELQIDDLKNLLTGDDNPHA